MAVVTCRMGAICHFGWGLSFSLVGQPDRDAAFGQSVDPRGRQRKPIVKNLALFADILAAFIATFCLWIHSDW